MGKLNVGKWNTDQREGGGGGGEGYLLKCVGCFIVDVKEKWIFLWSRYGMLFREKRKQKLHAVYNYSIRYICSTSITI